MDVGQQDSTAVACIPCVLAAVHCYNECSLSWTTLGSSLTVSAGTC